MAMKDDMAKVAQQERLLRFDRFDLTSAWSVGEDLRRLARERDLVVSIDIRINGMQAFFSALPDARPDFEHWIRRKRNLVERFLRSSYGLGLELKAQKVTMEEKWGLSNADYAAHGGCFPIFVNGVGCIGTVTVSGLPQRDDHNLVVEVLALHLGLDSAALQLS